MKSIKQKKKISMTFSFMAPHSVSKKSYFDLKHKKQQVENWINFLAKNYNNFLLLVQMRLIQVQSERKI